MVDFQFLKQTFTELTFFKDKTWQYSPSSLELSSEIANEINKIGEACFDFLTGINKLYNFSKADKSILRNKHFMAPWVADYFDRGKPENLLQHSNLAFLKHTTPNIIRLDLLLTEEGLALTEIEVIPGGIGFTSFLHQIYEKEESLLEENKKLIGSSEAMLSGFYESMVALVPNKKNPVLVIGVSQESETYRPEFEWLANELRKSGKEVYCIDPENFFYENSKLKFKINDKSFDIDVIYRFFELFDLATIGTSSILMEAVENQEVVISPPLKPIFEEKLCLALFHHYQLQDYWEETLKKENLELLKKVIPATWIIDGEHFGPNAILNGPIIDNHCLRSWEQVSEATKKNRNYIIKLSGFHEKAWGARSITLGSDCSQEFWANAITQALDNDKKHPYIIQEFKKPKSFVHPLYEVTGEMILQPLRARLCPYYMRNHSEIALKGILATLCPADKKIIHGMSVATFVPCKNTQK